MACVGAHRRRQRVCDARARPVDREAYRRANERVRSRCGRADAAATLSNGACSLVPGEDRLAVTVEMVVRGRAVDAPPSTARVIRSDARLDLRAGGRACSPERRAGRGVERGALRGPGRGGGAGGAACGGRGAGARVGGAGVPFDGGRHRRRGGQSCQTESHRLIEHLMIAANEAVASFLERRRRADAVSGCMSDRSRWRWSG